MRKAQKSILMLQNSLCSRSMKGQTNIMCYQLDLLKNKLQSSPL